ncbi:MAG: hypothetical protein B7Z83_11345 [Thiomonas sp. 20-64-5]|nr:MAG: hypothetical protein B7Z83_11345 [Thiomonas sp. 20-64-5]
MQGSRVRFGSYLDIRCERNDLAQHVNSMIFVINGFNFPCDGMRHINAIGDPTILVPMTLYRDPIPQVLILLTAR